jgi:hypothetical protein
MPPSPHKVMFSSIAICFVDASRNNVDADIYKGIIGIYVKLCL